LLDLLNGLPIDLEVLWSAVEIVRNVGSMICVSSTKTMQLNRNNFLEFLVQSEPGKPAIANGLRAALSLGIPMLIGQFIDQRESRLFVGLIAYFVNLANVAGSYQIKAKAMAIATFGITISVFIGTLVASIPILAVALTFLWGLASGFASLYGNTRANSGWRSVARLGNCPHRITRNSLPPTAISIGSVLNRRCPHPTVDRVSLAKPLPGESIAKVISGKSASIDLGNLNRIYEALKERQNLLRGALKQSSVGMETDYTQIVALGSLVRTIAKPIEQLEYAARSVWRSF
jgi:hypothetical protein